MSQGKFEDHKHAIRSQLFTEPKTLSQENAMIWNQIYKNSYNFEEGELIPHSTLRVALSDTDFE
jgi:secreted Zn-dependent insulinase-like peptidase